MTIALCLHCGRTKHGAIVPCLECGAASTGDMDLDIAFSDHLLSPGTLAEFGDVLRAIRAACDDDQLRFWSFIRYVSANHPTILTVDMSPEQQAECERVLARARPRAVVVRPSEHARGDPDSNESE